MGHVARMFDRIEAICIGTSEDQIQLFERSIMAYDQIGFMTGNFLWGKTRTCPWFQGKVGILKVL